MDAGGGGPGAAPGPGAAIEAKREDDDEAGDEIGADIGEMIDDSNVNNVHVLDLDGRGDDGLGGPGDREDKEDHDVDDDELVAEFTQDVAVQRLEDGSKLVNDFKKIAKLAEGALCSVKLYEDTRTRRRVAIKSFHKSRLARLKTYYTGPDGRMAMRTAVDDLQREVDLLAGLPPHDNVCKLLQVLDNEEHHKTYLVFPYYGGGRLMDFDGAHFTFWHDAPPQAPGVDPQCPTLLLLSSALAFCADVARGLAHLHAHNIVHRDVKPANMLLTSSRQRAILSDLGSGRELGEASGSSSDAEGGPKLKDTEGTYPFFSPEMCRGESFDAFAADVWALGVSVYATVFSQLPYFSANPKDLFDLIAAAQPGDFPEPQLQDAAANPRLAPHESTVVARLENGSLRQLLRSLLHPDPHARPSAQSAGEMLAATAAAVAGSD